MYKLLIVDDEEFEREGMAQLIDWKKYDIELVGTAWNGADGLRKTEQFRPDMILTDIKMPVMDGIELIRKVREIYPSIEFAVLSGYGEFEYTSRAMEQGVRHYILKPCDEDKIIEAVSKVKKDVDVKRETLRREEDYKRRVAPQAQKQLLRDILLAREKVNVDNLFRFQPEPEMPQRVRILVFRSEESFDALEEFMLGNMLKELLDGRDVRLLASTVIRNDAVALVSDAEPERFLPVARRIGREFMKIRKEPVRAALSSSGKAEGLLELYQQTGELFWVGKERKGTPLLHTGMFDGKRQDMEILMDFDIMGGTGNYADLLQSLQVTFLRMQKRGFSLSEKKRFMDWVMGVLYGEGVEADERIFLDGSGQSLMVSAAGQIYRHSCEKISDDKESLRYQRALEEIYRHFQDQKFGLHYLATEILYINEDYFGRFFQKMSGKKFTGFLVDIRISAAEQLIRLEPDIMVYMVSEMTGYASDGQYFSKIFKKRTGMTPSEYREKIQLENGQDVKKGM